MTANSNINPISDIIAASVKTLQTLLSTFQEDSEIQQEIQQTLEKLNAKIKPETPEIEAEVEVETEAVPSAETSEDSGEHHSENTSVCCTASELSDGDVVAMLALGFAAGAALVGGGVLLHKLLAD